MEICLNEGVTGRICQKEMSLADLSGSQAKKRPTQQFKPQSYILSKSAKPKYIQFSITSVSYT